MKTVVKSVRLPQEQVDKIESMPMVFSEYIRMLVERDLSSINYVGDPVLKPLKGPGPCTTQGDSSERPRRVDSLVDLQGIWEGNPIKLDHEA